jgi:hypothetical protein
LANQKLFTSEGFDSSNENQVIAAFAVRVGLEITEGELAGRLSVEAVCSHMRILKGIVGSLVLTMSPSEPILAIASALALNSNDITYSTAVETVLEELLLKGLILDRGHLGELSSRRLFLRAMDKTAMKEDRTYLKVNPITLEQSVQPVQLSEFLKTLLGDSLGVMGLGQEKLHDDLLREFSKVWINFMHFVQLPVTIDEVTPFMLFEGWRSGVAIQCAFHQRVIDGFFVVYFGRLDKPFDIKCLFVIPWQTKARFDASGGSLTHLLTAPFLASPGSPLCTKPKHVVMFMDLATCSAFKHTQGPCCQISFGRVEVPDKQDVWGGYAKKGEVEGERYCINIRSHHASNYPILWGHNLQKHFNWPFA